MSGGSAWASTNIDLEACAERDIAVFPATGANAVSVAEYVLAAMLQLWRPVYGATARVAAGEWPRQELGGRELAGSRLGLIGLGSVARTVAERASALGMSIAAYDPYIPPDDAVWEQAERFEALPELLRSSDAVSIHVPLTDSTRGLIDGEALALLPSHALLVNTSRGGIVDGAALVAALRAGRLGGAALDVFADEPLDAAGARALRGRAEPAADAAHRRHHGGIEPPRLAGHGAEREPRAARRGLRLALGARGAPERALARRLIHSRR